MVHNLKIRELEIKSRRANICNPTTSQCCAYECGITKCKSCSILNECDNISSRQTRKTYGIRGKLCCSSTNVVYSLQCLICNKQYIGETSTTLRERMNHHRSSIVNYNNDSALNLHLAMHQDKSDIKDGHGKVGNICFIKHKLSISTHNITQYI